ncbi:hypothetical protein A3D77_01165 [Candidatus Gottesmanbacteria bacterium RIFCSPHIGHO2_02_FULL_39_11]|uniref:LytR/CpsA/Psr regulator C-terminal domain-containing protein n=1 Tax=Candidatus Gottesmanbacteria bacterium RIFCSPHIGHO2_02_FULL_39_11 TaxID=1798382 RepID=A0A1F5ZJN3_9BACT|nr:MAG: hypothetical protein A3D77_01165 [Candidatus Gottesmanbacteria bacterium RIFCSPHIGHO2_02_FULL_39_11]
MRSGLKSAILYISKDKFDLWGQSFSQVLSFVFPLDLVRDLEVINHEGLIISVQSFIERNKIPPLKIVIVLSDTICFEKEVPENGNPFEREDILNSFADMVPFDRVSRKILKIEGKQRIIGTNKILWDTIRESFTNQGSVIPAVVPSSALSIPDILSNFNPKYARVAFTKAENLREANFFENTGETGGLSPSSSKPVNHTREIILGGVFLLLLIILVVLIIVMKPFSPSNEPEIPPSTEVQGATSEKNLIVYVTASEKEQEVADSLEKSLILKGFKEIRINFSHSAVGEIKTISFSPDITDEKRNAVISSVKTLFDNIKINTSVTEYNEVHIEL